MNFGKAIERVKTRSYIARHANWNDDWETKSDNTLAEWEYL